MNLPHSPQADLIGLPISYPIEIKRLVRQPQHLTPITPAPDESAGDGLADQVGEKRGSGEAGGESW